MQKNTNEIPPVVQENIDMLLAQKKLYERATGKYIPPVPSIEERIQYVHSGEEF
ncbi:MAG: hypothetical protein UGF89_01900 [Acutalibacteraceae bacterium]|nr:hypothetical protein [Acutalibacteraceae bacterium]